MRKIKGARAQKGVITGCMTLTVSLWRELGDLADAVSRQYVYEKIKEKTGLCVKTIAYVLNHTERE